MPHKRSDPPEQADDLLVGANHLDEETVKFILDAADGIDAIVVGGQALNILAEIFYERAPEDLAAHAPYTSRDLDYWGMPDAARAFADRVGGRILFPAPNDVGPSTAQVVFDSGGRRVEIDFLATVAGIGRIDPTADTLEIELVSRTPGHTVRVIVLRPALVLKSRLANISTLRRTDPNTIRQARAALVIAREDILQTLDDDLQESADMPPSNAIRAVRELADIVCGRHAFDAWNAAGIDSIRILEDIATRNEWHPRFREHQILGRANQARQAWDRKQAERLRKLESRAEAQPDPK